MFESVFMKRGEPSSTCKIIMFQYDMPSGIFMSQVDCPRQVRAPWKASELLQMDIGHDKPLTECPTCLGISSVLYIPGPRFSSRCFNFNFSFLCRSFNIISRLMYGS